MNRHWSLAKLSLASRCAQAHTRMDSAHALRLDPDIAALSPSTPKMTHRETLVERPGGRDNFGLTL